MTTKILGLAFTFLMVAACGTVDETPPDAGTDTGQDVVDTSGTDIGETCDGPDPSISCMETGCEEGFTCTSDVDGCAPSTCGCSDGMWECTADCGPAFECVPEPSACDTPDPSETCMDTGCAEGFQCVPDPDACVSGECFCEGEAWTCTDDCNPGFECVPDDGPGTCDTPDPSETCAQTGCDEGYECVPDPDACVSGGCYCQDGVWNCTDDCNPGFECVLDDEPSACDTPDPSETCLDTGCETGFTCSPTADDGCYPSACFCTEGGEWECTDDCERNYECAPDGTSSECPASAPVGESCDDESLSCAWGTECCCGTCSPSMVCDCFDGSWACYATDACFIESCEGRTCDTDVDCEGGGVETYCVDGMCAYEPAAPEWSAGPRIPLTIGACGDEMDAYSLNSVTVDDDMLNVSVSYSGGCAEHEFRLCWSGTFSDAAVVPVETTLELRHNGNGDMCEAYPTEELTIPISAISDAYREAFDARAGSVRLILDGQNAVYGFN